MSPSLLLLLLLQVYLTVEYVQGSVQEEILFIINPELIISRLLTEELDYNEALIIRGTERFSSYRGYGSSFEWSSPYFDTTTERDHQQHLKTEIIAIDAINFSSFFISQFEKQYIDRELTKAYAGFLIPSTTHYHYSHFAPTSIATGNWGCGVFKGDAMLKSLIQVMAASIAKRTLIYFTFGNELFANRFRNILSLLQSKKISVGKIPIFNVIIHSHF